MFISRLSPGLSSSQASQLGISVLFRRDATPMLVAVLRCVKNILQKALKLRRRVSVRRICLA